MIVSFRLSERAQDEYVVCPRAPATVAELRERMLKRARVIEGSYAYRLIDDLHAMIFVRSLDLKADYEQYFAIEYRSFGEFLRRRTRIPSPAVARLTEALDVSSGMYQFDPTHAFLTDTYGLDFLTKLLEDTAVASPPAQERS